MEDAPTLDSIKEVIGEEEYKGLSRAVFKNAKNLSITERGNIIAAIFNLVHATDDIRERNEAMEILLRLVTRDEHSFHLVAMKSYPQVEKAVMSWWNEQFFKVAETGNQEVLQELAELGEQLSALATAALLGRVIKHGPIKED